MRQAQSVIKGFVMGNNDKVITLLTFDSIDDALKCKGLLDKNKIRNTIIDKRTAYTFAGIFNWGVIKIEIFESDLRIATNILFSNGIIPSKQEIEIKHERFTRHVVRTILISVFALAVLSVPGYFLIKNEISKSDLHHKYDIYESEMTNLINKNMQQSKEYYDLVIKLTELRDSKDSYYFWVLYMQYLKLYNAEMKSIDSYGIILGELSIHEKRDEDFGDSTLKDSIRILKNNKNRLWEKYAKYLK
jgi:hypothetical protein